MELCTHDSYKYHPAAAADVCKICAILHLLHFADVMNLSCKYIFANIFGHLALSGGAWC